MTGLQDEALKPESGRRTVDRAQIVRVRHLVQHADMADAPVDQVFEARRVQRRRLQRQALMHRAGGQAVVQILAEDDFRRDSGCTQPRRRIFGRQQLVQCARRIGQRSGHRMCAPQPAFAVPAAAALARAVLPWARRSVRSGRCLCVSAFWMVARHFVRPYKAVS